MTTPTRHIMEQLDALGYSLVIFTDHAGGRHEVQAVNRTSGELFLTHPIRGPVPEAVSALFAKVQDRQVESSRS